MFRRDFELLNEAYAKNIMELNLGQMVQDGPGEGLSPEKRVKIDKKDIVKDGVVSSQPSTPMKKTVAVTVPAPGTQTTQQTQTTTAAGPQAAEADEQENDEGCEECGGACGQAVEDTDSDTYMAKQLLYRTFKLSSMIYGLMVKGGCDAKVEAWVLDKISKAHDNLNSVFGYKDFEDFKHGIQKMGGIFEETEMDLYNAINKGGNDLVSALKGVLKKESLETRQQVFAEVIKLLDS